MQGKGKKSRTAKGIAEITSGSIGSLLTGLATIGNILQKQPTQTLVTGSLLAPSVYGIVKGAKRIKKGKGYIGEGKPHEFLSNRIMKISQLKKMMKAHPMNVPISVHDLNIPKEKIQKVLNHLKLQKQGSGVFSKVKKGVMNAKHKLGKFFRGETKYKPSDLLGHIAQVSGVASAFAPEFMIPALLAQAGQQYAARTGRGLKLSGQGLNPAGRGLKLAGQTKPYIQPHWGNMKLPVKIKKFVDENPQHAHEIAKQVVMEGEGKKAKKAGQIIGSIALPTLGATLGVLGYREYLRRNPMQASRLAGSSWSNKFGFGLSSDLKKAKKGLKKGIEVGYKKSKKYLGSGKSKKYGTREEVYNGGALMTRGKLTKEMLMLHPRTGKIISRKRHLIGMKNKQEGKGIYSNK